MSIFFAPPWIRTDPNLFGVFSVHPGDGRATARALRSHDRIHERHHNDRSGRHLVVIRARPRSGVMVCGPQS